MQKIHERYKVLFKDKKFLMPFISGLLLLGVSMVINYYASMYAVERASSSVTDIILSNIPVFDVDAAFVIGPIVFWIAIFIIGLSDPRKIPFVLKNIALFVIIRSFFITLTHIGPFPDHTIIDTVAGLTWLHNFSNSNNFFLFSAGGDLFFSGHTGLPYLMALVFWEHKAWRILCLASAVFFGAVVLMGHLHYSIDVASAFFITYAIYHLGLKLFKKDKLLFAK